MTKEENVRAYADIIHAACLAAYLRGAVKVATHAARAGAVALAMGGAAYPSNLADRSDLFDVHAPVKVLEQKGLMTKFEFDALDAGYKRYSFTVAWVDSQNLLAATRDALSTAVREGQTFEQWRESVNAAFAAEGFTHPATGKERLANWHLHTVFETNVMSAYSAANWDLLHDPDVAGIFRFYQWDTLGENTCELCAPLNGVTLPVDDPFWLTHWPLLHYKCHCTISALDHEEAQRRGIEATDVPPGIPSAYANGFGQAHGAKGHWAIGDELLKRAQAEIARNAQGGAA